MKQFFCVLSVVLCLCSCNHSQQSKVSADENVFKYAQNVFARPGSDTVVVYCNWNTSRDSIVYVLSKIKNSSEINSIAALSTTDIAMLAELDAVDKITGVSDYFRISNEQVQMRYSQGLIQNVGTAMDVNVEALVALNPDIVITSAFSSSDIQKFQRAACPVIFTTDWQENTPLARVEWIKFIGRILGESEKADSVFSVIERNYLNTKSLAADVAEKPVVLAGAASNDIWYLPGGKSYVAALIDDAGGDFIGKDNDNTGSVVVNFEQILQQSQNADLWIGCDEKTVAELDAANKNYKLLTVYQKGAIYNRSKRCNANGGNDYWEYGYVRPDIVLADYMKIIHPELLPEYETVFLEKIDKRKQ